MTQDPPARGTSINSYTAEHAGRYTPATLPGSGLRFGFCSVAKPRCVGRVGETHGHLFRPKDPDSFRGFKLDFFGRCQHRQDRGGAPCDILLYVLRVNAECLFVVEVTAAMLKRVSETPTTILETIGLIGILLPGVPFDLGEAAMKESRDPEAFREFQRRNADEAERRAKGGE